MIRLPALCLVLALNGCAAATGTQQADTDPLPEEITRELHASADAWNRGDLDGFLRPYLDSSRTTFAGSSGIVHGLDRVRAQYLESYWSDGRPDEDLEFEVIEVDRLGSDHALLIGRYHLTDTNTDRETGSGLFSLVYTLTEDGWRIMHDHSSASGD